MVNYQKRSPKISNEKWVPANSDIAPYDIREEILANEQKVKINGNRKEEVKYSFSYNTNA